MSKALVNALTLALIGPDGPCRDVTEAMAFAAMFVEDNADLLTTQVTQVISTGIPTALPPAAERIVAREAGEWQAGDSVQVRAARGEGETAIAARHIVATRGPDGLTARQHDGMARGARLCPNCQQPEDAHAPGCARIPGVGSDSKAVTRVAIPPLA